MNRLAAKRILLLYRPGAADPADPAMAEALELARQDQELNRWFEQHCAFQTAMRAKFRQIPAPDHLKQRLLAQPKIVRLQVWWRNPVWLAAAASIVGLIGLAGLWLKPRTPDRFADYQARMVRAALREYRMDLVTTDLKQVRQFMAANGAPADYVLTRGLERLQLAGGGLLRWRSNPVAMVCFNRGDDQILFLFVMNRAAVKDPPPVTPRVAKVNKLLTASWSSNNQTYVLAGPEETDFVRKYLQPANGP
jgi:hypothetical protein